MKNKLHLSTLAALVMVCSGGVFAEGNSVTLTTTLSVEAVDTCAINVAPVGKTAWSPKWTLAKNAQSGNLTKGESDSNSPLLIRVKLTDDSSPGCSLANLSFDADAPSALKEPDLAKKVYLIATQHEGYWRYMPVATKLALFTDTAGTAAKAIALSKVTVKDAAGDSHTQSESVVHSAMAEVTGVADFGSNTAIPLTDSYLAANGVAPLAKRGNSAALSYSATLEAGQKVKSALIGVGVLLAKNPEKSDGTVKLRAVENGETISLPFTLNVTLQ
ncbi:hypothetical protein [Serratia sp. 1D1416]|uniref:hypothetical protein n=1 Tax=Serratia sp. 1D1416 TaxID=2447890 RepID=UPI001013C50E|nr:hypothetical protein [Serratia sp. 1D1416]